MLEADGTADQAEVKRRSPDLDYSRTCCPTYGSHEPLRYEQLLLEAWFKSRFTAAPQ